MSSTNKKPKRVVYTTLPGIAIFPYLTKPDTKFKADGEFRVELKLDPADVAKFTPIIDEEIRKFREEDLGKCDVKTRKLREKYVLQSPIVELTDEEGEATGEFKAKFKKNAIYRPKDKDPIHRTVPICDAKGKIINAPPAIYGGSVLRVAFAIGGYFVPSAKCYGATLYIEGVKLLELKTGGSFNSDVFGGEEEGFSADDESEAASTEAGGSNETTDDDASAY